MKKLFKRIHLWLAIPAGVFITIICATGAIMVFQTEIEETLYRDRYFTKSQNQPLLQLDTLVARVNSQLVYDTVKSLKVYNDPNRNIVATLTSGQRIYAYINPHNGKVVEINNARSGFFHKVMTLHRWLMLPNRTIGKIVIGVSTIFLVIILITGIIRWWPKKKIERAFLFKRKNVNGFRKTLDLHRILGAYVAILLIVMSLTGLMWSFQWYRNGVFKIFGQANQSQQKTDKNRLSDHKSFEISWEKAYKGAIVKNSDKEFLTITEKGYMPTKSSIMSVNKSIHVGSWGGLTTKILWFLSALIGASLPITGYILYIKRL